LRQTSAIRTALVLMLVIGLWLLAPAGTTRAAGAPVPSSLYPARAHTTYFPDISNGDVDCQWGFVCPAGEGFPSDPLFHSLTQDELHRTGGWAETSVLNRHGRIMLFFLFASRYAPSLNPDGIQWVVAAFDDLDLASRAYGFVDRSSVPQLLASMNSGEIMAKQQHTRQFDSYLLAFWTGSQDAEALAVYNHASSSERQTALRDLTAQVRVALHQLTQPRL
jgi:hypothetical protein